MDGEQSELRPAFGGFGREEALDVRKPQEDPNETQQGVNRSKRQKQQEDWCSSGSEPPENCREAVARLQKEWKEGTYKKKFPEALQGRIGVQMRLGPPETWDHERNPPSPYVMLDNIRDHLKYRNPEAYEAQFHEFTPERFLPGASLSLSQERYSSKTPTSKALPQRQEDMPPDIPDIPIGSATRKVFGGLFGTASAPPPFLPCIPQRTTDDLPEEANGNAESTSLWPESPSELEMPDHIMLFDPADPALYVEAAEVEDEPEATAPQARLVEDSTAEPQVIAEEVGLPADAAVFVALMLEGPSEPMQLTVEQKEKIWNRMSLGERRLVWNEMTDDERLFAFRQLPVRKKTIAWKLFCRTHRKMLFEALTEEEKACMFSQAPTDPESRKTVDPFLHYDSAGILPLPVSEIHRRAPGDPIYLYEKAPALPKFVGWGRGILPAAAQMREWKLPLQCYQNTGDEHNTAECLWEVQEDIPEDQLLEEQRQPVGFQQRKKYQNEIDEEAAIQERRHRRKRKTFLEAQHHEKISLLVAVGPISEVQPGNK